jgi:hypothetical protein
VAASGVALAALTTPANVPEVNVLLPVVDSIPPVGGRAGHPRRRPEELYGGRA